MHGVVRIDTNGDQGIQREHLQLLLSWYAHRRTAENDGRTVP